MTDPLRIAARLDALGPAEPAAVTTAREALEAAQRDLHLLLQRRADAALVGAARYRVQRLHDLLEQRWHDAALRRV